MAKIELHHIAHSYEVRPRSPDAYALRELTHVWEDGGAYALLGPSGCGKTTLLNIVSGLLQPTTGRVLFDGVDVTDRPTEARNIAQVFQFPVIYDTMTVFDNLAFPLRNRRYGAAQIRERVNDVAEMLELKEDLGKRARGLSADAKQKISLGRGLVRSDVSAILFDEPLTVIDPHLKWSLRRKLKQIHEQFRLTLVYVTHDQNEALTFADLVVVMSEGQVLQLGTPQDLFERPEHTFVGHFIGSPGMNLLPCSLDGDGVIAEGVHFTLPARVLKRVADRSERFEIGVRPEYLELAPYASAPGDHWAPVLVSAVEDLGTFKLVTVRLQRTSIKVKVEEGRQIPSSEACLVYDPNLTKLYANGRLID